MEITNKEFEMTTRRRRDKGDSYSTLHPSFPYLIPVARAILTFQAHKKWFSFCNQTSILQKELYNRSSHSFFLDNAT